MRRLLRATVGTVVLLVAAAACTPPPAPGEGNARPAVVASTGAPAAPAPTTAPATTAPATTAPPPAPAPPAALPAPTRPAPPPAVFRSAVSPVTAADLGASWRPGCPVPVEGLRAVDVLHVGYDGAVHEGRLVVAAAVADDVVAIMADLYAARFPVERMVPVDAYGGDDDASMAANNTSAFNCRAVTGGSAWSEHSYGRAIDLNPLVNPYVAGDLVLPATGTPYVDRSRHDRGMLHDGDLVVGAFASRGWAWGGEWSSPTDYQHFSTSGR